jgi:hypothetical protein
MWLVGGAVGYPGFQRVGADDAQNLTRLQISHHLRLRVFFFVFEKKNNNSKNEKQLHYLFQNLRK